MIKNKVLKDTHTSEKKKRTEWPAVVYLYTFGLPYSGTRFPIGGSYTFLIPTIG